jgi:hypothetical protein
VYVPSQTSERLCICVLGYYIVPVPSQTSERLCICVLGYYIVPVPSQISERLCICVLGYYIVPVPSQTSERLCKLLSISLLIIKYVCRIMQNKTAFYLSKICISDNEIINKIPHWCFI